MSRFLIWSDIHRDVAPFDIPTPDCNGAPSASDVDAILLPGDLDVKGAHVDLMREIWDIWQVPVLAVAGNHEAYGAKRFQKHLAEEIEAITHARKEGADISVLRCATRVIGDTRIVGATLWSDFNLWPEHAISAPFAAKDVMNDYKRVQWHCEARGVYRKMTPQDTRNMHRLEKRWILDQLDVPFEGKTLVMTHHLPVREMLHERRRDRRDVISSAYASDLWGEIREKPVDYWVCGHSHDCQEITLEGEHGPVGFRRNIRGYPHERTGFDPNLVLDTAISPASDEPFFPEGPA